MAHELRLMSPGPKGMVTNEYGKLEKPPHDWSFLSAGDAAVTRKVTANGPCWRVQIKSGRRIQSTGIWAPTANIITAKKLVADMRSAPDYAKKKASAAKSREKKQASYSLEFEEAIAIHLGFAAKYKMLEKKMAQLITAHAIPVGSGTVARTKMIPIEERAAKAVIAWMRHQTTNYDHMKIARIKGERRSVRRQLADQSTNLLKAYRKGEDIVANCPLRKAIN